MTHKYHKKILDDIPEKCTTDMGEYWFLVQY